VNIGIWILFGVLGLAAALAEKKDATLFKLRRRGVMSPITSAGILVPL
jgi:hypothetical protein